MTRRDDESIVSADELAVVLREHEGPPHPLTHGSPKTGESPRRRRYRRAALLGVAVVVALLTGSGLGFGLGSSVTASSSARANVVGFGFLPARNWNVMQSGAVGAGSKGYAVAANVPLRETVATDTAPYATLDSLPPGGVVIAAAFGLRGDPGEDFRFSVGRLPLRMADATPVPPASGGLLPASVMQYRLRIGVGATNVDARIYFGSAPTQRTIVAAQQQLERLVVASERVTIAARPTVVGWNGRSPTVVTLFGSVDNGRAGETVEVQAKDCGQSFFRVVDGATSVEGGGWSTEYFPGITTTLRAVWNDASSAQITVRHRAFASLRRLGPRLFEAGVAARASLWRKKMLIQRFDRRLGTWQPVRSVVLTDQEGGAPSTFVSFSARFKLSTPKGTTLRAVLPTSQARPCYLSGTSLPVRT